MERPRTPVPVFIALLAGLSSAALSATIASAEETYATVEMSVARLSSSADYVEIRASQDIVIDLRYDTTKNFTGHDLYGPYSHPYLHRIAAEKLKKAGDLLAEKRPGAKLVVFDALRPRSVQYKLWDVVKGTPQQSYVANPAVGSIHNFGFAVDLSILDENGRELDMGTPFDDFRPLAQPKLEEKFLKEGTLTSDQLANRLLLRSVMQGAGFTQLPVEWWHFDALPPAYVRQNFSIVE